MIDDIVNGGRRLCRKLQHPTPPIPKHSMLKGSFMSWRCEIVSLHAASLRSLPGSPTLNAGERGLTWRAGCTSNAHMRALRTFVRQQSSQTGVASSIVVTAVCFLNVVMATCAASQSCQSNKSALTASRPTCKLCKREHTTKPD